MPRFLRGPAPEIDEQSDDEIPGADQVLINDGWVERHSRDDDAGLELNPAALDAIVGLVPYPDCRQRLRDVDGFLNRKGIDFAEDVAGPHPGVIGAAVTRDAERLDARCAVRPDVIDPGDAVVRQPKTKLLREVNAGGNSSSHGQDR